MLPIAAFLILISFMLVGDVISTKTKALIPALLVFVILLVIGVWSGMIPENIVEIPGFTGSFSSYIILMFIVDMGSSISLKQLKEQWKTVVIGIASIAGVALTVLTAGAALFGWQTAATAAPPLSGGLVAMIEMSNAAKAAGNESLARLPVLIFITQSIPAYLLLPSLLKKESKMLLASFDGRMVSKETTMDSEAAKATFISAIPEKYKTPSFYLFGLAVLAVVSMYISKALNYKISPTVFALLFGLFATEFGILESGSMKKSGSTGFLMFAAVVASIANVASSKPDEIAAMLVSLVSIIGIGIVGIAICSILTGRILRYSPYISLGIGLNCLLGFPYNYILTVEAVKASARTDGEHRYLMEQLMPTMLIAGFVTVTLGSVFFASVMKNFV